MELVKTLITAFNYDQLQFKLYNTSGSKCNVKSEMFDKFKTQYSNCKQQLNLSAISLQTFTLCQQFRHSLIQCRKTRAFFSSILNNFFMKSSLVQNLCFTFLNSDFSYNSRRVTSKQLHFFAQKLCGRVVVLIIPRKLTRGSSFCNVGGCKTQISMELQSLTKY